MPAPRQPSLVLSTPAPTPEDSAAFMAAKLAYHTDAWDVAADLRAGLTEIVVLDTRSPDLYRAGHIPGALCFPHTDISADSTAQLDKTRVYVCYCNGIGCNGSTHGAHKLARLGFRVKELLGGLEFWRQEGWPIAPGDDPGSMRDSGIVACGC